MAKVFTVDTGGTLTTGLLSYLKLDSDATDFFSTNNGTPTNISYATGKINNAASFNGSSSKISLPTSLSSTSSWSTSFWMKSNGNTSSHIFEGGANSYFSLEGSDTGFKYYVNNTFMGGTGAISTGTWYHIICTWNEATSTGKLYVNGLSSTSRTTSTSSSISSLWIGCRGGEERFFNGLIDEHAVWNKLLSAQEISDLYNGGSGNTMTTTGIANIKTFNGLAVASIKTFNGLAWSSIKTINGLN